ncbi:MAG: methyltransferase domain-containing protein [Burkholderiales bacterium]|nr:methyltransferase domain-containing protein [Burkholderiales bacterium]
MDNFSYNYTQIRKTLNTNAKKYHLLEFILAELAKRMIERLDYIKLMPKIVLDCGSGLSFDSKLLKDIYPKSHLIVLDSSIELLKLTAYDNKPSVIDKLFKKAGKTFAINADAYSLPIKNQSVDFVYSNQLLPYLSDLVSFFKEVRRVTTIGGAFFVSGLGVDSFKELRELGLSTFRFPDMHDIGDMLIEVGFTNPVVDTEHITLEYDKLSTLLEDIRIISCGSSNDKSLYKYLGKDVYMMIKSKLNQPIKLTLEIFVAHGWKDKNIFDLPEGHQVITFNR